MCDLVDPAPEPADPGVEGWSRGLATPVTPGNGPGQDPAAPLALAHQPSAAVALTTIAMETAGVRGAAGAQRSVAGVAVAIVLLTLPR